MAKRLLRAPEISERLGITEDRVWDLIRRRMLPAVRIGRQVRVDEDALEAWIRRGGSALPNPDDGRQQQQ